MRRVIIYILLSAIVLSCGKESLPEDEQTPVQKSSAEIAEDIIRRGLSGITTAYSFLSQPLSDGLSQSALYQEILNQGEYIDNVLTIRTKDINGCWSYKDEKWSRSESSQMELSISSEEGKIFTVSVKSGDNDTEYPLYENDTLAIFIPEKLSATTSIDGVPFSSSTLESSISLEKYTFDYRCDFSSGASIDALFYRNKNNIQTSMSVNDSLMLKMETDNYLTALLGLNIICNSLNEGTDRSVIENCNSMLEKVNAAITATISLNDNLAGNCYLDILEDNGRYGIYLVIHYLDTDTSCALCGISDILEGVFEL